MAACFGAEAAGQSNLAITKIVKNLDLSSISSCFSTKYLGSQVAGVSPLLSASSDGPSDHEMLMSLATR